MELKPGYKQTEVGVIPEDWGIAELGTLAMIERGKFSARPRNDPQYYDGKYPFLQTGDVTRSGGRISSFTQTLNERGLSVSKLFPCRTLFFTIAANIGDVGIADFEAACPDSLVAISPRGGTEKEWLLYELAARKENFQALASPGAQLNINLEKLRPFVLPVPTLPEQRAIATALSDMDALLDELDRLIVKRRAMKQATIQQLLTGRTRLPEFNDEWKVKTLGDVVERFVGGGTPSRADPQYWGNEIPWVTVKDFATFNPSQAQESITKLGLHNSATNLIPAGTLITSTRMALGKAVIYQVDVTINQDLKALFLKPGVDVDFLLHWFAYYGERIDELGSGSTVKGVSVNELKRMEVVLPCEGEQTAIATVLSDMDTEITALEARRTKTRALKQAMMQELLTGRTRLVTSAEKANEETVQDCRFLTIAG